MFSGNSAKETTLTTFNLWEGILLDMDCIFHKCQSSCTITKNYTSNCTFVRYKGGLHVLCYQSRFFPGCQQQFVVVQLLWSTCLPGLDLWTKPTYQAFKSSCNHLKNTVMTGFLHAYIRQNITDKSLHKIFLQFYVMLTPFTMIYRWF